MTSRETAARRLADASHRTVGASVAAVLWAFDRARRAPCLLFALAVTFVYYWPSIRNQSADAGYLYGGDVIGFYWPSLVKTHELLSSLHFNALDFSLFNASSDFFVTANFFACHPIFVAYSLLSAGSSPSIAAIGHVLALMLAFHSFIAVYFSLRLLREFFGFEFGMAAFVAMAFAFSVYMLHGHGEPEFVFSATIIPWVAYGALRFASRPGVFALLAGGLPVVFGYLGGYMPLGVACIALGLGIAAARLCMLDEAAIAERLGSCITASMPFLLATLVASPYLFSVWQFQGQTSSAHASSLFFSAHQLADAPQTLLRLFSPRYSVPGPLYEFSVTWGLIPVTIVALFLLSKSAFLALSSFEWTLLKLCAAGYFLTVLCIFGEYSVVSDLVYYFVPQVGKMHIYQRFLLGAQLLFGTMIALMLKALIDTRPALSLRLALSILAAATLVAAYVVAKVPTVAQDTGINNYIVLELGLAFLFVLALALPGRNFAYGAAIVLSSLPTLDIMYDYSHGGSLFEEQRKRQPVVLDSAVRADIVSFMRRHGGGKKLLKYADTTPLWTTGQETFPKSFPYLVHDELNLSSYGGFNFYLSSRADYMARMPVQADVAMNPDWQYMRRTGVDFVVARESDVAGGALAALTAQAKPGEIYHAPRGVAVVPLDAEVDPAPAREGAMFDNGYFRVTPAADTSRGTKLANIAAGKPARQSSTAGGDASRAVDGNTNGAFDAGSVTHTGRDANAWLEIDLGRTEPIDSVRIWNRTDCCSYRLRDFWIFISDTPFQDTDTAATLHARKNTWGKVNFTPNPSVAVTTPGVSGRYVRVQLGGANSDEAILSLAEVEVFRADPAAPSTAARQRPVVGVSDFATNGANYLRLQLESSGPATVEYLFWPNPRLKFYLNGEAATAVERDGLRSVDVPAGKSVVEVRYRHWPLTLFWLFELAYLVALAVAGLLHWRGRSARRAAKDEVPIQSV